METNLKEIEMKGKAEFNKGTNFCREGQSITGRYLGVLVAGNVLESRVKYGGKVQHKVEVQADYEFLQETRKAGSICLVDEDSLIW